MEIDKSIYWSLLNGIVVSNNITNDGSTIHAPFSLKPYKYPLKSFYYVKNLSSLFNKLVHQISRNNQWLLNTLENTAINDEFTGRLMNIYKKILSDNVKQPIILGLHRSDYMLHNVENDSRSLMQVELNTIAASFGSLSSKISDMHRTLFLSGSQELSPPNYAHHEFADGIAKAHELYLNQRNLTKNDNVTVVMIVQPGERNVADQWHLQFALLQRHGITCLRYSLHDIFTHGTIDKENSSILKIHNQEISVVYFRAGYTPNDYPTESEWIAREIIEYSAAVKCPNISYHLVGAKKVQQVLANPGELEKFLTNEECEQLRAVFAGLYSLDPADSSIERVNEVKEMLKLNPNNFVLKPQREGGGNNIYGEDIIHALNTMSSNELTAYIAMEKIHPPSQPSTLIRRYAVTEVTSVCELGIYSVYLSSSSSSFSSSSLDTTSTEIATEIEHINSYAGYLLRVKGEHVTEGGVAAGYSVLSSVELQN